jgi:predicted Zn-dependent peptidase
MACYFYHDPSAPVVTSVMYHVGSKDENPRKTGFAHFSNIYYLKELKT